jgi:hypothetical protein
MSIQDVVNSGSAFRYVVSAQIKALAVPGLKHIQ